MSATTERTANVVAATTPAFDAEGGPVCALTSCMISKQAVTSWAGCTLEDRLDILRDARHRMAAQAEAFAAAISPDLARSKADTLAAEVLPLLDAIRFLERNAKRVLAVAARRGCLASPQRCIANPSAMC
jgi:acyl-CoA reductase-like NAD-dependent aldehyde dehydrogenase